MWSSKQTWALVAVLWVGCDDSDDTASSGGGGAGASASVAGASGRANSGGSGGAGRAGSSGSAGASGRAGSSAGAGGSGDADQAVTIRFAAKVFDKDFACGQTFDGIGKPPTRVDPADLRFYVQDLALLDADGKEVKVKLDVRDPWQAPEVALVDFQTQSGACVGTKETNTQITGRVPAGTYKGVVFSNGVPESLNHEDPVTQPAPLQFSDLTWGWLSGFRFFLAEVHSTEASDEDGGVSGVGLVHTGSAACTGLRDNSKCSKPNRNHIVLNDFDPESDAIIVDIGEVFSGTDVTKENQCHGSGEACAPMFERLGINYETGQPTDTQKVYRVQKGK